MALNEQSIKCILDLNLSSVKTFVQLMFDSVRSEVKDLREENLELRKSLEFTQNEMEKVKSELVQLKQDNGNNSFSQNLFDNVSDRVRALEDGSRVENIRITGLPELPSENSEQTQHKVQKLISEKLELNNIGIISAFRAGKNPPESSSQNPRPIIAKLSSVTNKIACFKSSNRLKGTSIFISEDVSKATMDIRSKKFHILKQKREEGFIAYFSGTDIVTKMRRNTQQTGHSSTSNASPHLTNSLSATATNSQTSGHDSTSNVNVDIQLRNQRKYKNNLFFVLSK